ncbi:uncharacterized protein LOC142094972 isoform X2 [Mixophyes fleayi]|uniref:uncharacterized protein LOC142094972 isoform X2 n=1 Tax=Mixophyes fleayi TaxID=3061075 RepID=UPI003F4DF8AD
MIKGQLHSISVHENLLNKVLQFLGLLDLVLVQDIKEPTWKEFGIFKDAEGQGPVRSKALLKSSPVFNISANESLIETVIKVEIYNYYNTLITVEVIGLATADVQYSNGHIGIVSHSNVNVDPNTMKVISTHETCGSPDVITTVFELIKQIVNTFWDKFRGKLKVKIPLALPVGTPGTVTPAPVTPCKPHQDYCTCAQ